MLEADRSRTQRVVRFGDFELRVDETTLLQNGRRLKLQPQPFRLLAYLISRAPSIVNREELGEHIWNEGVHVDLDQSLNYCIRQIRQVLNDDAMVPRYVETLPRQGYRFICPVELVVQSSTAPLPALKLEDRSNELLPVTPPAGLDVFKSLDSRERRANSVFVPSAEGKRRAIVGLSVLILSVLLL